MDDEKEDLETLKAKLLEDQMRAAQSAQTWSIINKIKPFGF